MFVSVSVKAKICTDESGGWAEIPVLLTPLGVLEPLLDYCLAHSHDRSLAWTRKVIRSVEMFLEYLQSNPMEHDTYRLLQSFAQRLYTGTFDRDTGLDPSALCWFPRGAQDAHNIITQLTDFFDWLSATRPAAANINPRYAGGIYDRMTDEAAYQFRRDRAFLGHTWAANANPDASGHRVRAARLPRVDHGDPPAFPDDRFEEFLTKGFSVGGRPDYRNMLITLLLHGAGFRASEPFHLYIQDVFPDPANERRAMVRIYHPHHGDAPADWFDERGRQKDGNRAKYLAEKFGLVPRNQLMDARHAGWKGGMHSPGGYYKRAYWFLPEYGEYFLELWRRYLKQIVRVDRNHPFAFINLRREPRGGMYCLGQYNKAHAAACERIGLTVVKGLGTTPHGHRHAYGRRLRKAGIDKALCRRCMHHASIESQEVYSQATAAEALAALSAAAQRLRSLCPQDGSKLFMLDKDEFNEKEYDDDRTRG
jgi:integrase